ncbi:MAG: FAD synthetase family protein [Puniceicoccales bacterium]|jgi:riboflavin kinase/FMN adenylyltransferase|nr:FAD synthetase family protein [Puniceicoccales bacterium]
MLNFVEILADGEQCDLPQRPLFMAIGTFDGVHLGHVKLISTTIDRAVGCDGIAIVYTFRPHPTVITHPNNPKPMLCTFEEKYKIFLHYNLFRIAEQKFDENFSRMTPSNFVEFLIQKFPTLCGICVGENFKFGQNRSGNTDTLVSCLEKFGISVTVIPALMIGNERVSSSKIRELLNRGDTEKAKLMLGRGL